jgi:hypothetical protein
VSKTVRNVAIIAAIAAVVVAVPGGGRAANLAYAILSISFAGGVAFYAGRVYLERRVEILSLDDRYRALLYGALAVGLLTLTATSRLWASSAGTLAWIAVLAACFWGVATVYRAWRQY